MEPNDSGLSSYYHHHPQPPHQHSPTAASAASAAATTTTTTSVVTASPTNGILLPPQMVYPHSVSSAVSPPTESLKKKRGRPRKYATPEQAAAARRALPSSIPKKKDRSIGFVVGGDSSSFSSCSSSKKTQLASLGSAGQGFAPHIISVAAGEDVYQRIMLFMQQSKCEICILSASGSVSNPSLRQPATFGGNITYEGRFDILSLCGSYIHTELGGRSGGLSVCLSSTDGQIIGGGIGGPFRAAGPVQVIVGTFVSDAKKDITAGAKANSLTGN